MNSIFDQATIKEITDRINRLTPSSPRLWGTMDVAQMLAHCSLVMEMSLGDRTPKAPMIMKLAGRFMKPIVASEKPFKQNMPTDKSFVVSDSKEFEKEKARLLALINRMQAGGAGYMHNRKHAFFGTFTAKEWSNATVKHLDHHLKQFGV